MAPFYGWGSTASRLEPFRGGSLHFTTKFPDMPGAHFIDLGRMKGWVDLRFEHGTKGYSGFFFILFRSWVICKDKKRPGFYTLVFYIFINNSRPKQNKKNPEHAFVEIVK